MRSVDGVHGQVQHGRCTPYPVDSLYIHRATTIIYHFSVASPANTKHLCLLEGQTCGGYIVYDNYWARFSHLSSEHK